MPYRIKARNQAGNTVTRWDMRNPQPIRSLKQAQEIAKSFAESQVHHGPWTGFVEYYNDDDSIRNPDYSLGDSGPNLRAKPRPGMIDVDIK